MNMAPIRLDIGCGSNKKASFFGVDKLSLPNVDFVMDLETGTLPFADRSVSEIYSYHALEHLRDPTHIFSEIGRVAADGAKIEIWNPYAFSPAAYIPDHKFFFAEEIYYHICVWYVDFWHSILHSYWHLEEIFYICTPETLRILAQTQVPAGFAIRFLKDVCKEFGVFMRVSHSEKSSKDIATRFVAPDRAGEKIDITNWWVPAATAKTDFISFHRKNSSPPDSLMTSLFRRPPKSR